MCSSTLGQLFERKFATKLSSSIRKKLGSAQLTPESCTSRTLPHTVKDTDSRLNSETVKYSNEQRNTPNLFHDEHPTKPKRPHPKTRHTPPRYFPTPFRNVQHMPPQSPTWRRMLQTVCRCRRIHTPHTHSSRPTIRIYCLPNHLSTSSFSPTGNILNTCATPFKPPDLLLRINDATSKAIASVFIASIFS